MLNPLFRSVDGMRYYTMTDGVVTCVIETTGHAPGSIEYDFNTGFFQAHKPQDMRNIRWFYYLFGFIKICRSMVKTAPVDDELL